VNLTPFPPISGMKAPRAPNQNTIWFGNTTILNYEQQVVQTGMYNPYPNLWWSVSNFPPAVGPFSLIPGSLLVSPIPGGGQSFPAFTNPTIIPPLVVNISNFNQRWAWVLGVILPSAIKWEAANANINSVTLMSGGYN
jgi:hypothetical protein